MESVDPFSYYRLGAAMTELLALKEDNTLTFNQMFRQLIESESAIDDLMKSGLEHSKSIARDLLSSLYSLPDRDEQQQIIWNQPLTTWKIGTVKRHVRDLRTVLIRECPALPIFFVPQKGLHRTIDLITQAELDFPEAIRPQIPSAAIAEIQQAGKGLAFDMFTAHAIHMMRAAEIVVLHLLREYYNETVPVAQRSWSRYVDLLGAHRPDQELLRYLGEVVRIERNESIHPTKLLDETEAQMVYTIAKGAIMAMLKQARTLEAYDPLVQLANTTDLLTFDERNALPPPAESR